MNNVITQDQAVSIARDYAEQKDGVSSNELDSMEMKISVEEELYQLVWISKDPYIGGLEYIVEIDKFGNVIRSQANPLAPVP